MTTLDVRKHDLLSLDAGQLEGLVARLARAEVARLGHSSRHVRAGGALTAPDGGLDIRVDVPDDRFRGRYIPRANTVFQVKQSPMRPAKISREMRPSAAMAALIEGLARRSGAYVIVSLGDDTKDPEYRRRIAAMQAALPASTDRGKLHLDFYDRSRLHDWLGEHPAVQIWLRCQLGKPLSGWRPHGRWTATPAAADDGLICEDGVEVLLPDWTGDTLSLADALSAVRTLLRTTPKAVRIIGLSGVGKTRFVQALFEPGTGAAPLEAAQVIYADAGDDPNPSAVEMLDTLIALDHPAVLVLDNCPADLHGRLAARIVSAETSIRLITVEYDIRDESNQTTDVVRIEATGTDIAEKLVARRHPELARLSARRIAEFSQGNARLALSLAGAVPAGLSLAQLSDRELFDRLFHQRHDDAPDLRQAAEALALVYSFSVEPDEEGVDELALLGSLCGQDRLRMHRASAELLRRQIAQQRGRWRAVLPHAIANRLAASALDNIPTGFVEEVLVQRGSRRLLRSFARRLGYLHDHPVARRIVGAWLAPNGLLSDLSNLNDIGVDVLRHVAPVAPDGMLALIERHVERNGLAWLTGFQNKLRTVVLNLLAGLVYETDLFERAIKLLVIFAEAESDDSKEDNVRGRLNRLFQLYLSGTHASPDQRAALVREHLLSAEATRQNLALGMLGSALEAMHWSSAHDFEFGARLRDYGLRPDYVGAIEWFRLFLALAREAAKGSNADLRDGVRKLIADKFRGLWMYVDLRSDLLALGFALNRQRPWVEGWRAVRGILQWDLKAPDDKKMSPVDRRRLDDLAAALRPVDLAARIRSLVVGSGDGDWVLDEEFDEADPDQFAAAGHRLSREATALGRACAADRPVLQEVLPELFKGHGPYRSSFGQGLAAAADAPDALWHTVAEGFRSCGHVNANAALLCGLMAGIIERDPALGAQLLDECLSDAALRPLIVYLHPVDGFAAFGFARCLAALDHPDASAHSYDTFLWSDHHGLTADQSITLMRRLLAKAHGPAVLIHALAMRLHGKRGENPLSRDECEIGCAAAAMLIGGEDRGSVHQRDYDLAIFLNAALPREIPEQIKQNLVAAVFDMADHTYGLLPSCERAIGAIAKHAPIPFLNRCLTEARGPYSYSFGSGFREQNPFNTIPIGKLVEWCRMTDGADRWIAVADAISLFNWSANEAEAVLSDAAIGLLEHAPDSAAMVQAFAENLRPMIWSGSEAEILRGRRLALTPLADHANPQVAEAVRKVLRDAEELEQRLRESERQHQRHHEQTFE